MTKGNSDSDDSGEESSSDSSDSSADDDDPPQSSSQSNDLPIPLQQFNALIAEARSQRKAESRIKSYEIAVAHAQEWLLQDEAYTATCELTRVYIHRRRFTAALTALDKLLATQTRELGSRHLALANTKLLRGVCHLRMHNLDHAVQFLRDAVLQCQTAEGDVEETLAESLCTLAEAYRESEKFDKARTCIKQAYAILPDDHTPSVLKIRVAEELALITLAYGKYAPSISAFQRVLQLKHEFFGDSHEESILTLVSLGMAHFSLHQYDKAEVAFVRAIDLERLNNCREHKRLALTMEKLAGVYRVTGRFREAGMVEQGAGEILGRAIDMRLNYLKAFDAGVAAHRRGKLDTANDCYKQSLSNLEFMSDKHGADRIPVLVRLMQIAVARKRMAQSRTMEVEIEQGVTEAFPQESFADGLLRTARLFRVLGFNAAADACYSHLVYAMRKEKQTDGLLEIFEEHARLLNIAKWTAERDLLNKKIRRLRRIWDQEIETVQFTNLLSNEVLCEI